MTTITLSLVSHTNVGKTTLARTLLRRDIGEVRDEAHVTEDPEDHVLVETADGSDRLVLWDTPGFGDSARLWRALKRESNPFGWFLNEVWDRFVDRPFWSSQQAIRNVRDKADAVLYLVNASEDPAGAGYVTPELEILGWMGQPVLVLLNQTGAPGGAPSTAEDVERWRAHVGRHPIVTDVSSLDAFTRCWVQEGLLLERVAAALPEDKRAAAGRLLEVWTARNVEVYDRSIAATAKYLATTAADSEPMKEEGLVNVGRREMATKHLATRLDAATREWLTGLIADHGLEGEAAAKVRTRLEDFSLPEESVEPWKAGALGGAVSGALAGLAADIAAGGLTFGGGFVTGAILGGLGSAGVAHAVPGPARLGCAASALRAGVPRPAHHGVPAALPRRLPHRSRRRGVRGARASRLLGQRRRARPPVRTRSPPGGLGPGRRGRRSRTGDREGPPRRGARSHGGLLSGGRRDLEVGATSPLAAIPP